MVVAQRPSIAALLQRGGEIDTERGVVEYPASNAARARPTAKRALPVPGGLMSSTLDAVFVHRQDASPAQEQPVEPRGFVRVEAFECCCRGEEVREPKQATQAPGLGLFELEGHLPFEGFGDRPFLGACRVEDAWEGPRRRRYASMSLGGHTAC